MAGLLRNSDINLAFSGFLHRLYCIARVLFSCAWRRRVFASSFDWFTVLSVFFVIGWFDFFAFGQFCDIKKLHGDQRNLFDKVLRKLLKDAKI